MADPTLDTLVESVEGYNRVTAWREPGGGVVLSLTHRATDDDALLVRVPADDHVARPDSDVGERTNLNGPWFTAGSSTHRVCVYFETFHYASAIELDLHDGERILSVEQGSSMYRNVWIEGNEPTRKLRFPADKAVQ